MRTAADDLALQAWATTAYLITSTISTPTYGEPDDIFGSGSPAEGLATSMYEMAVFRALQEMGAGGLFAPALTILGDIVPQRERAQYPGLFLAVFGPFRVIGPVVGEFWRALISSSGSTGGAGFSCSTFLSESYPLFWGSPSFMFTILASHKK